MHELLLFAQIPPTQHSHLLSILAGIAAMQPQPFLERHLVFKPSRTPGSSRSGPGESSVPGMADAALHAFQTQTRGDTFYVQLVGALKGKLGGKDRGVDGKVEGTTLERERGAETGTEKDDETAQENPEKWTLQFRDLPEVAGRRPVVSRLVADYPIQTKDPVSFMSVLGYTPTTTFHTTGHRLTHLSTAFTLSRILLLPPNPHLLDLSRTSLLQVSLRVQDGSKPELLSRGIAELVAVKELLKGVVELGLGERLSLDTRVR